MKAKKIITRKEVDYFGIKLLVQDRMKYIAVDEFCEVYAYTHKPTPLRLTTRDNKGIWRENTSHMDGDMEFLGTVTLNKGENWLETLRKV